MANSTIIYACTDDGLAILNKPGTLPEWLPPRRALQGRPVLAAWAEPGPPIRVLAAVGQSAEGPAELLLSESGGREWTVVLAQPVTALLHVEGDAPTLYTGTADGALFLSTDDGQTWEALPPLEQGSHISRIEAASPDASTLALVVQQQPHNRPETVLLLGKPETEDWRVAYSSPWLVVAADRSSGRLYLATLEGVLQLEGEHEPARLTPPLPGDPERDPFMVAAPIQGMAAIPGATGMPVTFVLWGRGGLYLYPGSNGDWERAELPVEGEVEVTALERDPERRDRLYSATASGLVFESGNRGKSWQAVNAQPVGRVNYLFVLRI